MADHTTYVFSLTTIACETDQNIQGLILEASPLARMPITSLLPVEGMGKALRVVIDHQSREDEAVNGTDPVIKYNAKSSRYPLIIMLDGIVSIPTNTNFSAKLMLTFESLTLETLVPLSEVPTSWARML